MWRKSKEETECAERITKLQAIEKCIRMGMDRRGASDLVGKFYPNEEYYYKKLEKLEEGFNARFKSIEDKFISFENVLDRIKSELEDETKSPEARIDRIQALLGIA
ncbi:hypothetical protein [Borrelia sp. RT1S]|uniref:hypothetical protein n=1 Tax=Borrelia sp. RT1S TaxID=2898580 RepID=UPI001E3BC2F3|nr:hypothetical protein [Borrelia sp. RT1S]UGQ17920.1 hypothetical protein LSO05_05670 [Borrelia sp. RT1S]